MNTEQSVSSPAPVKRTGLYSFARLLAAPLLTLLFPVRYHHVERLRDLQAPCIVMSNHKSLLDPFLLAWPCKKYEIHFLGKKEITKNRLLSFLVRKLHMISVDRHHTDMQAMRTCARVLRDGQVLGIFPEGTRRLPDLMSTVETGVAFLALRSGAPLLPVYIDGKLRLFRRTDVYVGEPMDFSDLCAKGCDNDVVMELTARIRDTFLAMREASRA